MYALLFFFCLTGQSGPSACGHVANNNNNNNNNNNITVLTLILTEYWPSIVRGDINVRRASDS